MLRCYPEGFLGMALIVSLEFEFDSIILLPIASARIHKIFCSNFNKFVRFTIVTSFTVATTTTFAPLPMAYVKCNHG